MANQACEDCRQRLLTETRFPIVAHTVANRARAMETTRGICTRVGTATAVSDTFVDIWKEKKR